MTVILLLVNDYFVSHEERKNMSKKMAWLVLVLSVVGLVLDISSLIKKDL